VFGVDGQRRMEWKALHSKRVHDLDWAHADRCASAGRDKKCKIWDPQTGEPAKVAAVALRQGRIWRKRKLREGKSEALRVLLLLQPVLTLVLLLQEPCLPSRWKTAAPA
jgi:hypothetical protein